MISRMKSELVFVMILLFGGFTLLEMVMFLYHHFGRSLQHWLMSQHLMAMSEGYSILGIAISLFFIFVFVRITWKIIQQLKLSNKWYTKFLLTQDVFKTKYINAQYPEFKNQILVIENHQFVALTTGFIKPKIVISTFVMDHFSEEELRAILLHEQFHSIHRDPFRLMFIKIVSEGLSYIPMLKSLVQYYNIWRELLADQYAFKRMKSSNPLGSVLLKVSKMKANTSFDEVTVHLADVAMNYRIMQIIEPKKHIPIPIVKKKPLIVSVTLLFINVFIFAICLESQIFCHKFLI
ncbi:beta-lactamase regulating signal transducer with metallopeptidase domain [Anoxybacillus tepidamans]|uniref:Beta-lactamase regulating signal transducer with metallopeptidase domain n=1 Tax=Anoxybacteroides tepidamans TaxID=265948 RepID=A0A7W8ISL2_9BACL|nr:MULTISPECIES: M56 family metallopeptidase [Anoxybacillus]EMI10859.1 peptidase M56 BlaR1 [Anoxybacillus gonensis]MBB5325938.1 beta-lactamase regulating signal transducer with metallopeptidase domain [Anoxybacillus tepidamans]MCL6588139.1 M56 family metallopeptidase [Anoxybacillus sp.]